MAGDPVRAKSLFLGAADLSDPAERSAYLERQCGSDAELRERVEALLRANDESPLSKPSETVDSEPVDEELCHTEPSDAVPRNATADYHPQVDAGLVIGGRYTLQQRIGEGGMGEVWVARQSEPVKRKVALKLIKTGMDSRAVQQRFEQERQALAMMDHPNISRVLDGGLTPTGQPFFVMELVNGIPLNQFCDEARMTPTERLELFIPICHAIQHAHQKGIVHRDLKPANILVTMIDARPVPKVIDFGVAKAMAGKLTDESMSTQFGAVIGTLEYMSPEQAGFSGDDIDTRADIYSLGVILYELLTGRKPIDTGRLKKAGMVEMLRIIKEEEPSKPSTRLSTDAAMPSVAAVRRIEPKRLMALLRGELDWVVMKCLEKQRERRYETANALARDIQRYLADEPIDARPPSSLYRLGKLVRRHKGPMMAASLIVVALTVGMGLAAWQAVRATQAEKETGIALADSNRNLGELEKQTQETRDEQYAWDMQAVQAAWDASDVTKVRWLLDRQDNSRRHFEWRFWNRKSRVPSYALWDGLAYANEGVSKKEFFSQPFITKDGKRLAVTGKVLGSSQFVRPFVRVFDLEARSVVSDFPIRSDAIAPQCRLSQDGRRVLVTDVVESRINNPESWWGNQIYDVATGKLLFPSEGQFTTQLDNALRIDRQGKRLVVEQPDGQSILVFNLETGEELIIPNACQPNWHPSGTQVLALAIEEGRRQPALWDAATGAKTPTGLPDDVLVLEYSSDSTRVAGVVVEYAEAGQLVTTVRLWDAIDWRELSRVPYCFDAGQPSDPSILSSVNGKDLRIGGSLSFNAMNTHVIFEPPSALPRQRSYARTEVFRWQLIDFAKSRLVFCKDLDSFKYYHRPPIFTSDGSQLVASNGDRQLAFIDCSTGRVASALQIPIAVANLECWELTLDDRLRGIHSYGQLLEWDLRRLSPTVMLLQPEDGQEVDFQLSADGDWAAILHHNADGLHVEVRDAKSDERTRLHLPEGLQEYGRNLAPQKHLRISRDGRRLALWRYNKTSELYLGAPVSIKTVNGQANAAPRPGESVISPDLIVWDVAKDREPRLIFHKVLPSIRLGQFSDFAISDDGSRIAISCLEPADRDQPRILVFDVDAQREIQIEENLTQYLKPPSGRAAPLGKIHLHFGPDRESLRVLDGRDEIRNLFVWSMESNTLTTSKEFPRFQKPGSPFVGWSLDGRQLALLEEDSGNCTIGLYEVASGERKFVLSAVERLFPTFSESQIAFSPDGQRLAFCASGNAQNVILWDTTSGKQVAVLNAARKQARSYGDSLRFQLKFTDEKIIQALSLGGQPPLGNGVRVREGVTPRIELTTWDATPLVVDTQE